MAPLPHRYQGWERIHWAKRQSIRAIIQKKVTLGGWCFGKGGGVRRGRPQAATVKVRDEGALTWKLGKLIGGASYCDRLREHEKRKRSKNVGPYHKRNRMKGRATSQSKAQTTSRGRRNGVWTGSPTRKRKLPGELFAVLG